MFNKIMQPGGYLRDFCHVCEEPLTEAEIEANKKREGSPFCTWCRGRMDYYNELKRK